MLTLESRGKRYYTVASFKSGFSEVIIGACYENGTGVEPTEYIVQKSWMPGKYSVSERYSTGATINERSKTFTVEKRGECKEIFQHALEYFNYCTKEILWDICL